MLHFPECVKKAQAEIDQVVGDGRMPNFEDQSSLPYLMAFIKETMRYAVSKRDRELQCWRVAFRWKLVTPTGISHSSIQEYTYKGFVFPKDTIVYANTP